MGRATSSEPPLKVPYQVPLCRVFLLVPLHGSFSPTPPLRFIFCDSPITLLFIPFDSFYSIFYLSVVGYDVEYVQCHFRILRSDSSAYIHIHLRNLDSLSLSLSLSLSAWNLISVSSLYFIYHASVHSLRFIRFYSFTSSYSHRFISWVHLFDLFSSLHFLRYSLFLKEMSTCLPQLSYQPHILVRPQPHRSIPVDT
jgi:hypothetical protein